MTYTGYTYYITTDIYWVVINTTNHLNSPISIGINSSSFVDFELTVSEPSTAEEFIRIPMPSVKKSYSTSNIKKTTQKKGSNYHTAFLLFTNLLNINITTMNQTSHRQFANTITKGVAETPFFPFINFFQKKSNVMNVANYPYDNNGHMTTSEEKNIKALSSKVLPRTTDGNSPFTLSHMPAFINRQTLYPKDDNEDFYHVNLFTGFSISNVVKYLEGYLKKNILIYIQKAKISLYAIQTEHFTSKSKNIHNTKTTLPTLLWSKKLNSQKLKNNFIMESVTGRCNTSGERNVCPSNPLKNVNIVNEQDSLTKINIPDRIDKEPSSKPKNPNSMPIKNPNNYQQKSDYSPDTLNGILAKHVTAERLIDYAYGDIKDSIENKQLKELIDYDEALQITLVSITDAKENGTSKKDYLKALNQRPIFTFEKIKELLNNNGIPHECDCDCDCDEEAKHD